MKTKRRKHPAEDQDGPATTPPTIFSSDLLPPEAEPDLRPLVDPADVADRGGPPEPSGQPVAAPSPGTRPAAAGVGGPGPRRQAPAQPAGAGLAHRQQPGASDPSPDRHAHARVAQRRPR